MTAAKKARLKLQDTVYEGDYRAPTDKTLGEVLEAWLAGIEGEVEPTTFINYASHVRQHISPALGKRRVATLKTEEVKAFYSDLLKKPSANGRGTLSTTTTHRIHATLHCALESLVESGELKKNPAHKAKLRSKKSDKARPKMTIWTPGELDRFLDFARDDRLYALWHVLAWTGMRRGEAAGLQHGDVDLDDMRITVQRAISVASYETHVTAPKSGQTRVIDLDKQTVDVVRAHIARQKQERFALGLGRVQDDDWLFCSVRRGAGPLDYDRIHPGSISKAFDSLVAKSELRRVRLHDLRHAHASHLILSGANIKVVQERLGHASVLITLDVYGHLLPTSQRDAIEALATSRATI